ncbi:MAG: YeeE/YedE family protein [Geminocystis sp.]|nr:YeeE/YedE family protein [Geminocystis sp.]HIK38352.1 YeeE/YedE family protein [Geminocystis sp. M7585_C2015_104]MCS7148743.1 YeeE/YedE family protein [Geminocystis sp.]MCX8078383.1 YeeE/YedE family protein [Geminocystis sp.]MDW8116108.1 YeeE/YedE family protein [Geminocystis sp.]
MKPQNIIAILSGLLFGLGLGISQMVDREKVLGFLDVAGKWDATLIFVLGGAVVVTLIAFRFILSWKQPLLDSQFHLPARNDIDSKLIVGAAIFGIGWGISGYCPGPAVTSLVQFSPNPFLFVIAFVLGSLAYKFTTEGKQ